MHLKILSVSVLSTWPALCSLSSFTKVDTGPRFHSSTRLSKTSTRFSAALVKVQDSQPYNNTSLIIVEIEAISKVIRQLRHHESETTFLKNHGIKLLKSIGHGAHGRIYMGQFSTKTGESKVVACKVINLYKETTKTYREKFLPRELNILTLIKHPYIISIHSIIQSKTKYYIFMSNCGIVCIPCLDSDQCEMLKKTPQSLSDTKLLREQGYRLIKLVGEGSYAQVYLGEFIKGPGESIRLACKIINAAKARKSYTQKFLPREIKVLSSIKHPHIIHIYSIFQRKASYFIFMRYAEKGDLFEYIKLNGPIKENQARVWVRQIALAIQYLHTLDIAHRDLKCENVLVTTHLNLKLTDFGFARYVKNELGLAELSETFCGSKQYVAPEILHGAQYDAKAADMWSFGVIIYTTLNKSLPFNQRDKRLLYSAQMKKEWGFRRRVIDTVSSEVRDLVTSLLEPDPLKRIDIGSVVNSSWIGMDAKLQKLSKDESDALYAALEATKSVGGRISIPGNDDRGLPAKRFSRQSKDVVYWKHMHTGLEVDVSRLNKFDDVI